MECNYGQVRHNLYFGHVQDTFFLIPVTGEQVISTGDHTPELISDTMSVSICEKSCHLHIVTALILILNM